MEFEDIKTNLGDSFRRARIFGGWLVTVTSDVIHDTEYNGMTSGHDWRTSVTFVFDPFHLWRIYE